MPLEQHAYKSLIVDLDREAKVATVTLNRPDALNAIGQTMLDDFSRLWPWVRADDDVNAVVVRAAQESKAFTSGADVRPPEQGGDRLTRHPNVFVNKSVFDQLSPRLAYVWKPVIVAVHGICAGAGLFIVNEGDIVICSDDAQFFDPHLSIGITSALGPVGMSRRVNLGEVLRYTLLSNAERLGAETALRIGLVTEVTARDRLWARADELARLVAGYDTVATQGSLKAIWESQELGRKAGLERAQLYSDAARSSSANTVARTERKPYAVR
jgi:enoyl-CoA hydratase/carnithine racemase